MVHYDDSDAINGMSLRIGLCLKPDFPCYFLFFQYLFASFLLWLWTVVSSSVCRFTICSFSASVMRPVPYAFVSYCTARHRNQISH